MPKPDLPLEGGCRCGQVRFRIDAAPLITMACHCRGCQQMTASAFSLSALVPAAAFALTAGEPVVGGLHGPTRHLFCPWCMSWVFTRPEGADGLVNVRATLLDDVAWFSPYMETFTQEKLPWASTPAVRSFEGFPALEDYDELLKAYAAANP
ncbi:MAG: GFA family protein [Phenylobacterium sp.]|uniref:GFA family protein n=1 Tax=Phenylobacterium sp. TaxID=1871053 RepID=UPI003919B3CB